MRGILFLKLALLAIACIACVCHICVIEAAYSGKSKAGTPPWSEKTITTTVDQMNKTSDLIVGWSILLLGFWGAYVLIPKGRRIKDNSFSFILLAPAGILLYKSVWWAVRFKQRLNFQSAKDFFEFPALNNSLFLQTYFFQGAIAVITIFIGVYIIFRLLNLEEPQKPEEG
jgi:hypothetical protein